MHSRTFEWSTWEQTTCGLHRSHIIAHGDQIVPHLTKTMPRWLSFFAEYNFQVEYTPETLNVVVDMLSRRPDYAVHKADANATGVVRTSTTSSSLLDDVRSRH
ncbi:unnamed protein product [Phytophthora fragariaefolia]|uniref:Unnamed protein product n=1 Tax=Phytophthora fragariaefolia TaxID=1490495 RepID=A0A9W6TVT9_9STRA|nr:unnamed protein product [Phytophthora fragariaefolia]